MGKDVEIHTISSLKEENKGAIFPKGARYAMIEEDNTPHYFPNESQALAFQRGYRAAQGLDPMTGEPKESQTSEGTEGQDRQNYTDDQDRENYTSEDK